MSASKTLHIETLEGFEDRDWVKITKLSPVETPAISVSEDIRGYGGLTPGTNTLYNVVGRLRGVIRTGNIGVLTDVTYNEEERYPDWHTSRIVALEENNMFRTQNSVYRIEKYEPDDRA